MSIDITCLVAALHSYLDVDSIADYCPNGLQVQGRKDIQRIVSGVTASQALIDAAIELNADAILVHHGYFWKNENPCITGMKYKRIKSLLDHDINLLAYHLPLDMHPEVGNNVQLANLLGLKVTGPLEPSNPRSVGLLGELEQPLSSTEFADLIQDKLQRQPMLIEALSTVKTVAWCTGAAQGYIEHAIRAGVDAFITGEISEHSTHSAIENNINYYAAGHHATERYGVKALGEWIATKFGIEHYFIDCPNPV